MKKHLLYLLFLISGNQLLGQQTVFDLFTFTPPAGWIKTESTGSVTYSITDPSSKNWCQLILCKKLTSTGSIESDFRSEWNDLIIKNYEGTGEPLQSQTEEADGWKICTGSSKWVFNNKNVATVLTTFTGFGIRASIVCNTTNLQYITELEKLLSTLKINPGESNSGVAVPGEPIKENNGYRNTTAYHFTNTHFDDGWSSTVMDNWVETKKGRITVKIHYPNKQADEYNSVLKTEDLNAWNLLVAPYYSQVNNFNWLSIQSYESISFMEADAVEKSTGKMKHVVLFKKHYSSGHGRYLEFVTDTRAELETDFGPYHSTSYGWENMADMQLRNKFAVASNDLTGTWSANDYASLTYYYVSNGATAGTTATSNSHEFTFYPGNKYRSEYAGASGQVGNMKFSTQSYKGESAVTDWTITLTNRFQGATEKFEASFEAIKGGRILILTDRLGTRLSLVKK
ncbi:MAG TPA: hypothetical protein PLL23_01480 [Chitinophagaceae bacterium]|nr:hypothetical protein [Chitinophagaceae bacterium]